jgi:hypothetical protein
MFLSRIDRFLTKLCCAEGNCRDEFGSAQSELMNARLMRGLPEGE